jgi:putative ATPase
VQSRLTEAEREKKGKRKKRTKKPLNDATFTKTTLFNKKRHFNMLFFGLQANSQHFLPLGFKMDDNQIGLFNKSPEEQSAPLAHQMRPQTLDDFEGAQKLLAKFPQLAGGHLSSMVFWGPPGCGKTTLAKLLAKKNDLPFLPFNAVLAGLPELRKTIEKGKQRGLEQGKNWVLFIDEIHRFNKAQQDALLPFVESGEFILMGATTENPFVSVNRALLSRVQTIELKKLSPRGIQNILQKALTKLEKETSSSLLEIFSQHCDGDTRKALNYLENFLNSSLSEKQQLTPEEMESLTLKGHRSYDKDGNRHYDVISAFIKSMRGSDPHAAVLWLAVMLEGGEDPLFIARRMVIFSSEDIGNADPRALTLATSCLQAVQNIGMPEARIILSQAATYLASTVKSNACYKAINEAINFVKERPTLEVPLHLKSLGLAKKDYKYPHDYPNSYTPQQYAPKETPFFYRPKDSGQEKFLAERLNNL